MTRQFDAMLADLKNGIPSIVCMHYDEKPVTTEHMRLVVGYDGAKGEVIYHEPAEANGAYRRMPIKKFLALWPLKYDRSKWTVIRFRMQPKRIAPVKPSDTFFDGVVNLGEEFTLDVDIAGKDKFGAKLSKGIPRDR